MGWSYGGGCVGGLHIWRDYMDGWATWPGILMEGRVIGTGGWLGCVDE